MQATALTTARVVQRPALDATTVQLLSCSSPGAYTTVSSPPLRGRGPPSSLREMGASPGRLSLPAELLHEVGTVGTISTDYRRNHSARADPGGDVASVPGHPDDQTLLPRIPRHTG